ncbi:Rpn family recombination-promoting nuclease/putative transposase [uncultured Brachyspira sp.]|uniref:Rpn family recombination-promoting nuclease/putative transposase n=2 Tax=uncultured Brachyspira sp. TaxID=221953 RepID=UPI0026365AEB|nr:Rpn family recombination-promoting nuclease/putative transposase [uncultured Brachyspira sp.]
MIKKYFNVLNDYFIRYLFAKEGHEDILKDLINSVRIDSNQEPFEYIEVLNSFNLKENILDKESIVDVKAKTKSGETIIIEIQRIGNQSFIYRSLYYWAKSYYTNLKSKDIYSDLTPVISINILDFNLIKDSDKPHSCYFIKELETNHILTNHLEIHFLELKKFNNNNNNLYEGLSDWFKFLNSKDKLEDTMEVLVKKNPIMKEVYDEYNKFVKSNDLYNGYSNYERDYFNVLMLNEERIKGIEEGREEGIKEGMQKGIEKGIKETQISMAKNMKIKNMDINLISELTGLSIKEIEKL